MNYKNPGLDRITKIRFSSSGTKFAATGGNGKLAIWNLDFNPQGVSCLQMVDAHSRVAWDLQFLGNDSLIATCGSAHRAG